MLLFSCYYSPCDFPFSLLLPHGQEAKPPAAAATSAASSSLRLRSGRSWRRCRWHRRDLPPPAATAPAGRAPGGEMMGTPPRRGLAASAAGRRDGDSRGSGGVRALFGKPGGINGDAETQSEYRLCMLNVTLCAVALHDLTHGAFYFSWPSVLADALYYCKAGAAGWRWLLLPGDGVRPASCRRSGRNSAPPRSRGSRKGGGPAGTAPGTCTLQPAGATRRWERWRARAAASRVRPACVHRTTKA